MDTRLTDILSRSLLLDLETGPTGEIRKIGAVHGDRVFRREGSFDARTALAELDRFAADAELVLGHNLLGHDLHALRARMPALTLLKRHVVDTLFLSPLVFPENPYHRLVKDYKLVRATVADPVEDCRLAARIFCEQWEELARRAESGAGSVPQDRLPGSPKDVKSFRGAVHAPPDRTRELTLEIQRTDRKTRLASPIAAIGNTMVPSRR